MASFDQAIPFILAHETLPGSTDGSYTNLRSDRGGPTKWGITQATLAGWRGRPVTADDVKDLGRDEACAIYRARYWAPLHCDEITSQAVAAKAFDAAVNCGVHDAATWLQQAVNEARRQSVLAVDGEVGAQTLAAVNGTDGPALLQAFGALQLAHYRGIVARDPSQAVFLKSWTERAMWPPQEEAA